jgi:DNA replicative helicase MCM subunit Mcm2 (Cdc46/Mcm family)
MNCPNCNGEKLEVFMSDPIKCQHCGDITSIDFNRCLECGCVFKSVADEIDPDSIMELPEGTINIIDGILSTIIGEENAMDEDEFMKILEDPEAEVEVKEINIGSSNKMASLVHRCLKCNVVAYEVKAGEYCCPECGFTWEVVDCV